MKAYIASCIIGTFAYDKDGKLLAYKLFPRDPKAIAEKLKSQETQAIPEEIEIAGRLKERGVSEFLFSSAKDIAGAAATGDNVAEKTLSRSFRELATSLKWAEPQQLNAVLAQVNAELTRMKLRKTERDKLAMQVVGLMDETDRALNVITEHCREWYGLYFPEINDLVKDHKKFFEFVSQKTVREEFEREGKKMSIESAGMELGDADLEALRAFARRVYDMYAEREALSSYLEALMNGVAPNATALVGAGLAARLVALAGGLGRLAKLPSSTIQLLGAEKAMFRYLKGKGRSPKHGIIFQHPQILQAPIAMRGKVARILASKIAIAARLDCYSKKDESAALKRDMEESIRRALNGFETSKK